MNALTGGLLSGMRRSAGFAPADLDKGLDDLDHAKCCLVLTQAEELYSEPIGKGIHRPLRVRLKTSFRKGFIDCTQAVFKKHEFRYETGRYLSAMDPKVSPSERELLVYKLDRIYGFDLVPPVVGRTLDNEGSGSMMAWVRLPLLSELRRSGRYDYRQHPENPWFHRCAAFDFICGQIDRHASNLLVDPQKRIYAIDNGYAFTSGDDRTHMLSVIGRRLVGKEITEDVRQILEKADLEAVAEAMTEARMGDRELDGVLKRHSELKKMRTWRKLGGRW